MRRRRLTSVGTRAAEMITTLFFLASSGRGGQSGGALTAIMPGVSGANYYCDSVPASTIVGSPDTTSIFADEHDFVCEDGHFLESVAVWTDDFVEAMVWRQVSCVCACLCRSVCVSVSRCGGWV